MPRYKHPSKYFADDKDISDLLLAEKFSVKRLIALIRERGILVNPTLSKEALVNYLSQMPFSWPQLQALMEEVQSPDSEEKVTTCQAESAASLEQFQAFAQEVREVREETFGEAWSIHDAGDGNRVFLRINYSEMDNAHTRTLQRIQKDMEIAVEKTADGFEFRYPLNARAENVVSKIISALPPKEGAEKVKRTTIELAGLVDPDDRTKFFILLMDGMDGYKRRDVLDLRMNRTNETDVDEDDEKLQAAERIKRAVKKMTLTGESLLMTPEFKSLKDGGFFISRAVWLTREDGGHGVVYEIEAQFKAPEKGTGFCYLLRGMHQIDAENDVETVRRDVPLDVRKRLNSAIEQAAYKAMHSFSTKPEAPAQADARTQT